MKKITIKLLSILTITLFIFSSCTKDRTCECRITESSTLPGDQSEVGEFEIEYEKVTKRWMKNTAGCVSRTRSEENLYTDYIYDSFGNIIDIIEIPYTTTIQYDCEIN